MKYTKKYLLENEVQSINKGDIMKQVSNTRMKSERSKLLETKLRKMVREELMKEENLGYGIKSNISEIWVNESVIVKDISGYLAECFDAGGKQLVKDVIDALKKAIMNSAKYTR